MQTEESQLVKKLCTYAEICDRENCPDNYETCKKYKIFKRKTKKLRDGRCIGASKDYWHIKHGPAFRQYGVAWPRKGKGSKKKKSKT